MSYEWALVSDHPVSFYHAVAYETSFFLTTGSTYDQFFEFPRWSLARASTAAVVTELGKPRVRRDEEDASQGMKSFTEQQT